VEFLAQHPIWNGDDNDHRRLLAETIEYLIELSGTRVESQELTHGVVITNALTDEPRVTVTYPSGLRPAKRSPLLFDGRRAVLVVDETGRARTEVQSHRLDQLISDAPELAPERRPFSDGGSLVAHATEKLGGIGFYLRADRSIWVFVDGRPLVVRRSEHWKAFPVWLARALQETVGQGSAVELVVQAALIVSMQEKGAIFGIVGSTDALRGAVALKDRYDLRDQLDPNAMQPETRLHHLIESTDMDAPTLARLAGLDGATIVDCQSNLLAYGAILTSKDSQHEGARTAAAKTLSLVAKTVLMVSQDGEIVVFQDGRVITTLL
jgi:DNA integrity scanning protein DisA with diadenylate cyclase activity